MSLLAISLNFIACSELPPYPEVWQCGYTIKFKKFRCVNTKTREAIDLPLTSSAMEGAQCLSLRDYKSSEAWVNAVKSIAERRCK